MHFTHAILLFFAAAIAGTLNALAGGGSFVSFPILLFTGVPAVEANATNTVALWPGLAASTVVYLKRLDAPLRLLLPLLVTSLAGGWAGALLLLRTPQPSKSEILEALRYNLCRCGAHVEIIRAAMRAAGHLVEAHD